MKKKTKSLIILLIVLVAAAALCVLALNLNKKDESAAAVEAASDMIDIVPDTDAVITNIAYSNEYGDFSFTLKEGVWVYDADESFPVGNDYINAIVTDINNLFAYRDITEEAGADSEYGLDSPAVSLKATYDDGNTLEFIFGSYNDSAMGYYMKHDSKIYIVGQGLYGDCNLSLNNMIKGEAMAGFDASMVNSITVNGKEYTSEEEISALLYEYQFITLNAVVNYKDEANYGFGENENKVIIKYTTTNYKEIEGGGFETVTVENEYSFRFTEKDETSYLIIDKPDGEVELIYICSGAQRILEAKLSDAEAESEAATDDTDA